MPQDAPHFPPSFYNDLEASLVRAWQLIGRGTVDRRSPMHTPSVATTGRDGSPQVRVVVLRGVDGAARTLRFHTDKRSGKFADLSLDNRICVLGYDGTQKIQLRLTGRAQLHNLDALAQAAWDASRTMSRFCYTQGCAPGMPIVDPGLPEPLADGYENFVVVVVSITSIEWLYLAAQGHRRARFTWDQGQLSATWLAP